MIELWKPSRLLSRLLPPQKLAQERAYRRSQYAFPFEADGRQCLFHTLTRQCYDLEGLELPGETVTGAVLAQGAELSRLAAGYFFVPVEKDEDSHYVEIIRLLRRLKCRKGRTAFTILTTTGCNARCVYCFEEGMTPVTMTPEITDRTLDFLCNTRRRDATLRLSWFGGEPLLNVRPIDRICRGLEEREIPFESSIITNGSLIDDVVLDRMAGPWRMRRVQISMDGDEQTYIRRKNYYRYRDEYHRAIDAAVGAARRGIRAVIRVNVDRENLDGVERFVGDLERRMERRSEVGFYLCPLYGEWVNEDIPELWERIGAYHMALARRGFDTTFVIRPRTLKLGYCMADNPNGTAVIAPDGQIYACEHCVPGTAWGSLTQGAGDRAEPDAMADVPPVPEKCRGCAMLPECTSSKKCPLTLARCREVRAVQLTWALRHEVAFPDTEDDRDGDDWR